MPGVLQKYLLMIRWGWLSSKPWLTLLGAVQGYVDRADARRQDGRRTRRGNQGSVGVEMGDHAGLGSRGRGLLEFGEQEGLATGEAETRSSGRGQLPQEVGDPFAGPRSLAAPRG